MKLFHWSSVAALANYDTGTVIVMAPDLDTARSVFMSDNLDDEKLVDEILNTMPDRIYDTAVSISIMGSA